MNGLRVERVLILSDVGMPKKVCIATPARNFRHPRVTLERPQATAGITILYRYHKNEKRPAVHATLQAVNSFTRLMAEVL